MVISKSKIAIYLITLTLCTAASKVDASDCSQCQIETQSCQTESVKPQSPSWWKWITGGKNSSQFHFFDLIELLNNTDEPKAEKVAVVESNEDATQSEA